MLLARRPRLGLGLALLGFLAIPFSLRYGVLQDAAKYYLVAVWAGAVAAGAGAGALAELSRRAVPRPWPRRGLLALGCAALLLGLGGVVAADPGLYGRRHLADGAEVVRAVEAATPPGAIVIAAWTYSTPLAYAEYVEHDLGGRQVVNDEASQAMVDGWLRAGRPVYVVPYDANDRVVGALRLALVAPGPPAVYRALPP